VDAASNGRQRWIRKVAATSMAVGTDVNFESWLEVCSII
jgi:hypothetical protein